MKAKLKFIIPSIIAVIAIIVAVLCIDFTPQEKTDVSSLMSTAQKYLIENQYEQAIAEFNKVIEIEPKNVDAYLGLAEAYVGLGDTDKAIEILEKGYEITGDDRLKEMLNRLLTPVPEETTVTTTAITLEETTTTAIKTAVMPNFVGLSYEDAEVLIQENGFIVEYDEIYSTEVEKNHIISQLIPENAEVPVGTTIKLTVSLGVEMVMVSDLTGLTKQEAEKLLADNKLIGTFTEEYSDTVKKGVVISQNISPNESVEADSYINIIISNGKEMAYAYLVSELIKPHAEAYTNYKYLIEYNDNGQLAKISEYWTEENWNNKVPVREYVYSYSFDSNNKIKIMETGTGNFSTDDNILINEYQYAKDTRSFDFYSLEETASKYGLTVQEIKKYPLFKINSDESISQRRLHTDNPFELEPKFTVFEENIGMRHTMNNSINTQNLYTCSGHSDLITYSFKYELIETDINNKYILDINRLILEFRVGDVSNW